MMMGRHVNILCSRSIRSLTNRVPPAFPPVPRPRSICTEVFVVFGAFAFVLGKFTLIKYCRKNVFDKSCHGPTYPDVGIESILDVIFFFLLSAFMPKSCSYAALINDHVLSVALLNFFLCVSCFVHCRLRFQGGQENVSGSV